MKYRIFPLLIIWLGLPAAVRSVEGKTAAEVFVERFEVLKQEYFRLLAAEVLKADRIEVYRFLDEKPIRISEVASMKSDPFSRKTRDVDWFHLVSSESMIPIGKKLVLDGAAKQEMAEKVSDMLIHPGDSKFMCYDPHHGMRVFKGNRMILELEICVSCYAFFLKYPEGPGEAIQKVPLPENGIAELLLKILPSEK